MDQNIVDLVNSFNPVIDKFNDLIKYADQYQINFAKVLLRTEFENFILKKIYFYS